jgi:hypothetical protein
VGANRATRSSRRPLLGACVRRDQEGRTEGFGAPARRAPKTYLGTFLGLKRLARRLVLGQASCRRRDTHTGRASSAECSSPYL